MMKWKHIVLFTLAFALIGGSVGYADAIAQKVRVWVNKQEIEDGGAMIEGKSYLSVRALADKLNAIVLWDEDTKKVTIFKPNVHMLMMQDSTLVGNIPSKGKYSFKVVSQIDNLKINISAFKLTIADPYGDETYIDGRTASDKDFPDGGKDNFWFTPAKEFTYNFNSSGKYVLRFWMKPEGETSYQVVSEKVITSK
jgi:hypothetical protein